MDAMVENSTEMSFPKLDTESDTMLEEPDLEQLRHDRLERNRDAMKVQWHLITSTKCQSINRPNTDN